jgi:rubredoxin
MRNWRPFTWVIVIINILFVIWIIGGASTIKEDQTAQDAQECEEFVPSLFETVEDCLAANEGAEAVGAGIGITLIIMLWVVVDIILGILWLVTNRKKTRECPHCGSDVKKGQFVCKKCGYDFRTGSGPDPAST